MNEPDLARLAVVLVRARNPLNIGAVGRAMQNFGVADLRVVQVFEASFREARSAVGAAKVMTEAREFATVADAVADCRLVFGTTAGRGRDLQQRVISLEEGAREMRAASRSQRVALLFGSEKHGLTRTDMDHCHALIRIDTADAQPSMNLGQAAAVCLWELRRSEVHDGDGAVPDPVKRAASGELERLTALTMEVLNATDYTQPKTVASTEGEVRRMLLRLSVSDADARILMGMLRKLQHRLRTGQGSDAC